MAPGGGKRKRGHGGGDHYQSSPGGHDRRPGPPRDQEGTPNNRRNQNNNRGGGRGGSNFGDRGGPGRQSRPGSSQSNAQSPRSAQPPHQFQAPTTPASAPPITRMSPPTPVSSAAPVAPPAPQVPEINASAGEQRFWEHLTLARLESWNSGGHNATVAELAQHAVEGNYLAAMTVVQEILYAGVDGRLSPTVAANVLIDAIKSNRTATENDTEKLKIADLLLDTLPLYEVTTNLTATVNPLIPDYISIGEARLHLHETMLATLSPPLVSNAFKGRQVKVHTNMLYRVQKYNLSREEPEGFSKLITEVFMAGYSSGPMERVGETLDNVRSLIGCFDLDPNRVLDILLDVFANAVVANYRFFIQLLRESEWWPKDTPSPEENPLYQEDDFFDRLERDGYSALLVDKDGRDLLTQRGGNKVAAQLIGFKFKFYMMNGLDLDNSSNVIPDNLVAMTAILLKIGFISFMDLYNHISPDDEALQADYDEWKREIDSKGRGGAMNALAMASALTDDTLPPPRPGQQPAPAEPGKKSETEAKPEEPVVSTQKPRNQKLLLLKHVLAAGALPEALFLFGKYPKISYPHPDVADHLHRLLHYCINDVYESVKPPQVVEAGAKNVISSDPALKAAAAPRQPLVPPPAVKVTKYVSPFFPGKEGDPYREYRYFWEPEWTVDLPICKSERDVRVLCLPLIKGFSGTRLANDVKLMSKLARIGVSAVKALGPSSAAGKSWADIIRNILLPALSLCGSNSAIGNEIFSLMELYPLETRFNMYGFWNTIALRVFPEVKSKSLETMKDTKNLLKRLSTSNVREMARKISKISYSNPVTVFMVIISQVESYDNLIECVVDSARHFSKMGFDAFTYSILTKMSEDRGRMQQDGLLVSKWLQALATFCGRLYKRYPELDPYPILSYISKKLWQENSADLIVLQEMIKSMAGIVGESNLSDVQIMALYGSENLRAKILAQLGDKRYSSRDSARRLAAALVNNDLAGQMLVLLAHERKICMYRGETDDVPIKVVANMYDEINSVMNMYMDMLNYTLDFDQWSRAIPSVDQFILEYHVEPQVAWFFCRVHVREQLQKEGWLFQEDEKKAVAAKDSQSSQDKLAKKADSQEAKTKSEKVDTDGEVVMTEADGETKAIAKDEDVTMADDAAPAAEEVKVSPFSPIMVDLMERLRPSLPEEAWNKISLSFYTTFWQLSIYELHCPITPYDEEIKILNNQILRIMQNENVSSHSRKRESEALRVQADRLGQDMRSQIKLQMSTIRRISVESQYWFADENYHVAKLPIQILQYCIMPRLVLSPHDASFCAKFIKRMHAAGTPKFWTLQLYDTIFERHVLEATIFMSTEREIENYGRFLAEILVEFSTWHKSKTSFERECYGAKGNLPGFAKTWGNALLDYEDFRRVLYKWHKSLHAALRSCLNNREYMHVRNATIVLKHVNKSFPAVDWIGKNLTERVQQISKTEKREDLKITTTALLSLLKRKEKDWVPTNLFQLSVADPNAKSPAPQANSKGGTPVPPMQEGTATSGSNLNPAVTPFKPNHAQNSLSQITVHTKSNKEVEDGEIDDLPSAKGDSKPELNSSISGLTPLPAKGVKDISGRSPTPHSRSATPSRDNRGRSDSRAASSRNNESTLAPSQEQRRGNSPRGGAGGSVELFPSKDHRDNRRDDHSRQGGSGRHDDRRERGDQRSENRNVLPQPPSSLPAKPNTPIPPPMPRSGAHRPESDNRGRQDNRQDGRQDGRQDNRQDNRDSRGQDSRRHGSPRGRGDRNTPRDQLPDLIDELKINSNKRSDRGGGGGGSGQRPGSDYRSRSPDTGRKRQETLQEGRMDTHGDYSRPPAGPRAESDRSRPSHGRESFGGGGRPPAGPSDHGRLNQDPNHGRLNPPEQSGIPSGPRGGRPSGGGGGSGSGGGPNGFSGGSNVPNGPSRTPGRTSLTLNNRNSGGGGGGSGSTAPSQGNSQSSQQASQAMPIHPDRARALAKDSKSGPTSVNTNDSPSKANPAVSPTAMVHPSRLAAIAQASGEPLPPSGPRGELPSPTGPSGRGGQQSSGGGRDTRRESTDHHHERRRARGLQDILSGGNAPPSGNNAPAEGGQSRRRGRGNTQGQGGHQQSGTSAIATPEQPGTGSAGGSDDGRRRDREREREQRDGRDNRDRDRDREGGHRERDRDRDRDHNREREGGGRDSRDPRRPNERGGGGGNQSNAGQSNRGGDRDRERDRDNRDVRDRESHRDRDRESHREGRENRGGDREPRDRGEGRDNRDRDRDRGDRNRERDLPRGGDREWDERARRDNMSGGGGGGNGPSRQGGGGGGGGGGQSQGSNNSGGGGPGPNQHGQKRPYREGGGDNRSREDAKRSRRG